MSDGEEEIDDRLLADPRLLAVLSVTATAVLANQAAPVALPGISTSLGVPEGDVGLVITAFFLPASVMLLVVGSLADVYGRRRVVLPSLFVFGAAGVGIFFVDSFAALLVLRGLQGAAFPALTPLSTAIIGDLYQGPEGATAQGLRSSANGLAGIVGPALAGALAGIAWQYPFLTSAIAFPTLAVVWVALPETAETDEDGERTANPVRLVASHLREVGGEFADPDLRLLALGGGVIYLTKFAVVTFVPLLAVRTFGASAFAAGLLLSVRGLVRIGAAPLSGRLVARTSRARALAGALCLTAGGTVLLPLAPAWLEGVGVVPGLPAIPPLVTLAVLMGAYSAGEALFNPVLNDTVVGIADPERRGGVVNTISVFKNGASALSPAVLGVVLTASGFPVVFALAAAVPVLYAVLVLVRLGGESADA